jgi:hypothetical protein
MYKKGIQYSHYCGTELQEMLDSIKLSIDLIDEDKNLSVEWAKRAIEMVNQLRIKISDLDVLNEMKQ